MQDNQEPTFEWLKVVKLEGNTEEQGKNSIYITYILSTTHINSYFYENDDGTISFQSLAF